jgi:hypothetical protein
MDTSALVKAFNKYYSDKQLLSRHGLKNIEIATERADWDKNFEKLKVIYKKLTGK